MRGYKKHLLVNTFDTDGEENVQAHTWAEPAATAVKRARTLKVISVRVENLGRTMSRLPTGRGEKRRGPTEKD